MGVALIGAGSRKVCERAVGSMARRGRNPYLEWSVDREAAWGAIQKYKCCECAECAVGLEMAYVKLRHVESTPQSEY